MAKRSKLVSRIERAEARAAEDVALERARAARKIAKIETRLAESEAKIQARLAKVRTKAEKKLRTAPGSREETTPRAGRRPAGARRKKR